MTSRGRVTTPGGPTMTAEGRATTMGDRALTRARRTTTAGSPSPRPRQPHRLSETSLDLPQFVVDPKPQRLKRTGRRMMARFIRRKYGTDDAGEASRC